MNAAVDHNEQKVAAAFSKQSVVFDEIYSSNPIIQYKRKRTRHAVLKNLKPGARILELNAGTGEDAIYFAQKGFKVHATDISEGMLNKLKEKLPGLPFAENITTEQGSFNHLQDLKNKGPYNHIFSNFGGLNCTDRLDNVLQSFNQLLAPGGTFTLVIIPPFCLWETLLIFKGRFRTATRRFFSTKGAKAKIEGEEFTCWYYTPGYVRKHLPKIFSIVSIEGLCTLVPPSYIETFPTKYPRLLKLLKNTEDRVCKWRLFCSVGDYFIVTGRKR
jgi:ubiquinone/menaquinone biosynthesis C-methylase UbiE